MNIGAFNLGNALGAALGAEMLRAGFGYDAVAIGGGVLALLSLMLVLAQIRVMRRELTPLPPAGD